MISSFFQWHSRSIIYLPCLFHLSVALTAYKTNKTKEIVLFLIADFFPPHFQLKKPNLLCWEFWRGFFKLLLAVGIIWIRIKVIMFMKLITLNIIELKWINQIRSKLQVSSLVVLSEGPCHIHFYISRSS